MNALFLITTSIRDHNKQNNKQRTKWITTQWNSNTADKIKRFDLHVILWEKACLTSLFYHWTIIKVELKQISKISTQTMDFWWLDSMCTQVLTYYKMYFITALSRIYIYKGLVCKCMCPLHQLMPASLVFSDLSQSFGNLNSMSTTRLVSNTKKHQTIENEPDKQHYK